MIFKKNQKVRLKAAPALIFSVRFPNEHDDDLATVVLVDGLGDGETYERFAVELELVPLRVKEGDTIAHESLGELTVIGWHNNCLICWQDYPEQRGEFRRLSPAELSSDKVTFKGAPIAQP